MQALRAIAVLLVILFHLWPDRLRGGYIGVDVFFVISGYLISSHLLREITASGRIRLAAFWARRIRRLLPAAFLVLAVSLCAVLIFLPSTLWQRTVTEVGASAVYVLNWVLASSAVDYFASDNAATVVQHFWSLSVEEQFYLIWPVLLLALSLWTVRQRRARTGSRDGARAVSPAVAPNVAPTVAPTVAPARVPAVASAIAVGMSVVAVASLAYSVWFTAQVPAAAYFSTFTHAWEFAAGGLLAVAAPALGASRWMAAVRLRAVVSALGVVAIVAAALVFTGSTPFPGFAALLPIAGTLAVIAAGDTSRARVSLMPAFASRPVQFVGDVSYSAYLWHWPPIVVLPYILGGSLIGGSLTVGVKIGILVGTFVLAALTKRFVEDVVRTAPRLRAKNTFSFVFAGVGAIVLVVGCAIPWQVVQVNTDSSLAAAKKASNTAASGADPCFGAAAALSGKSCPNSHRVSPALLLAAGAPTESALLSGRRFVLGGGGGSGHATSSGLITYEFADGGAKNSGTNSATETIALVGDSHSSRLLPALRSLAKKHGWRIWLIKFNNCSPSAPTWVSTQGADMTATCQAWRRGLISTLAADPRVDTIVTTSVAPRYAGESAAKRAEIAAAFSTTWRSWTDAGKQVVVVADDPGPGAAVGEALDCVAARQSQNDPCTSPRSEVVESDAMVIAAKQKPLPGLSLVDFTDVYCGPKVCHSVIGGLVVYANGAHLSPLFALTLAPYLEPALTKTSAG